MLSDTTPEAQRVYYRCLARLTPAERVQIALELTGVSDDLLRDAVRRRYPEATGREFQYRLLRARYGAELADRVYSR